MKVKQPETNIMATIFVPGSLINKSKATGNKYNAIVFLPGSK